MEGASVEPDKKKAHRERNSGRKADKKKAKKHGSNDDPNHRNDKAFAINSAIGAERRFRRKQDLETKKQHIPLVDRNPVEPPPILVTVVGPPKVGKTTLIKNLIKSYTKTPLTDIQGPVTIVSGKKRRITLIECNNDINSMIDLAKVSDLVLLLCDASFGFEMEIFEFLNICQVHGMPRIMGVLTHLDMLKNAKILKKKKKELKHRFWTEVYDGAKLFYLSGMIHGSYMNNEIKNLARFISVMKFRPITWRTTHSYLLADRYEDLTNPELLRKNSKCSRKISLYGYVRGIPLAKNSSIHLAGVGDYKISEVSLLPDPCPLPETIKKRSLIDKERLIYAPFSGVGGIVYDKDAVYVELGGSHSHNVEKDSDDEEMYLINNMVNTKTTLNEKLDELEMQIFTDGEKIKSKDVVGESDDDDDNDDDEKKSTDEKNDETNEEFVENEKNQVKDFSHLKEVTVIDDFGNKRRKVIFSDDDDVVSEVKTEVKIEDNDGDLSKIAPSIPISLKSESETDEIQVKSESESDDESDNSDADDDDDDDSDNNLKKTDKNDLPKQKNTELSLRFNKHENAKDKIKAVLEMFTNKNPEKSDNQSIKRKIDEENENEVKKLKKSTNEMDSDAESGFSESNESDSDSEIDSNIKWKENLAKKAESSFLNRQNTENLMRMIYGHKRDENLTKTDEDNTENDEYEIGGLFRVVAEQQSKKLLEKDIFNREESLLAVHDAFDWLSDENKAKIKDCFVTGKWKDSQDANELLKLDDMDDEFDDFEDLETGEKYVAKKKDPKSDVIDQTDEPKAVEDEKQALIEKKMRLKRKFDAEYDDGGEKSYYEELKMTATKQSELNKDLLEGLDDATCIELVGYKAGMYVRIEVEDIASEFVDNFDPTYPLVIGGLNIGEENIGYVNIKLKKHRWYKKILKTYDPVIFSLGWRRFQTCPVYSKLEDDFKQRYLKYTPEHVVCNANFWGPITPQGTGILAIQNVSEDDTELKRGFRIAATGAVQELDRSLKILKKLKLIGHPMKVLKKTAFVKDMFNSQLEVAKFEGAKIKTVSGIRGIIKKALNKPEGAFRATFEDKILMSDIVFCRTWYKVDVPEFYNPITNLLLAPELKNKWSGMKTVGMLKRERNIHAIPNSDNLYTDIKREPKVFKPFTIPKGLQKALPYDYKPKTKKLDKNGKPYEPVAVIKEPHEQEASTLMKRLKMAYEHKQTRDTAKMHERMERHIQDVKANEESFAKKLKVKKKEICRKSSKFTKAQEDVKSGGRKGKGRKR